MTTPTKYTVRLSRKERRLLEDTIHKGTHKARVIARARILLGSDRGLGKDTLAAQLRIGRSTVQRIRDRFNAGGLDHALQEDPRPGQPRKLNEKAEAHLIATACSDPPEGAHHWTLELLSERMVKDKKVETISSVAIMHYLHRNDLKPWREKNVVYSPSHTGVH